MSISPPQVRCRQITVNDTDDIVNLFVRAFGRRVTNGFRGRSREYFLRALDRLSKHQTPPGYPKYGYLLESEGAAVGALLLIYSLMDVDGEPSGCARGEDRERSRERTRRAGARTRRGYGVGPGGGRTGVLNGTVSIA